MIDLRLLRDDPDMVARAYAKRGGVEGLEQIAELDATYRELLGEVESGRAEHNRASKAIGRAGPDERPAAIAEAKTLADKLKVLETRLDHAARARDEAAAYLPNLPHESVPEGLARKRTSSTGTSVRSRSSISQRGITSRSASSSASSTETAG